MGSETNVSNLKIDKNTTHEKPKEIKLENKDDLESKKNTVVFHHYSQSHYTQCPRTDLGKRF